MRATLATCLLLCACAGMDPIIVSGESLRAMGDTFADTAASFDAGLDAGTVTPEQYRAWAKFGHEFKASYLHLVTLWELARDSRDAALEREVTGILARLATELATYHPPVDGGL